MSELNLREQITDLRVNVKILMQSHADMRRELAVQAETLSKLLARIYHLESQR